MLRTWRARSFCSSSPRAAEGEIYNLATGRETTIRELAEILIAHLGLAMAPEFDGNSPPGDPRNWRADIARLQTLGFRPTVSLEDGLRAGGSLDVGGIAWIITAVTADPPIVIFLHVPKACGTTLTKLLTRWFTPGEVFAIDRRKPAELRSALEARARQHLRRCG
jgi:hypothetical protein